MIWSQGDYLTDTLSWGWTCDCGQEGSTFGSATAARESLENHEYFCNVPVRGVQGSTDVDKDNES